MSDGVTVTLTGLKELDRAVKKLPKGMQRRVLNNALRAGGRVIQKKAKALVPVKTGTLKRSIVVRTGKAKQGAATVFVTTTSGKGEKNDAWYSHIVEFGGKRVRKQPFLRPAFDETHKEQLDAMGEALAQGIIKETAKL